MKEYQNKKRQTNLMRIKTKNQGQIGKHDRHSLLVYACYLILKEER